MTRIILFFIACILFSCSNNADTETTTTDTTVQHTDRENTGIKPSSISGCYLRVMQKDTLIASLQQDGNTVSGKLIFDNYEKDGSSGTVSGNIDGNILKLIYRFQSEGMNSITESYFKITDNGLIQGFGDIQVKGDSAYYSNPGNLSYDEKNKLKKIDCGKIKV